MKNSHSDSEEREREERLVNENVGLVVHLARSFSPKNSVDFDEYVQAGRIGLWKAIKKHDPSKGKLSSIAWNSIRWEIIRVIKKESRFSSRHFMLEECKYGSSGNSYRPNEYLWEYCSDNLTSEEKAILKMKKEGFTVAEICENMGIKNKSHINGKYKSAKEKIRNKNNE